MNFEKDIFTIEKKSTRLLPLGEAATAAISMEHNIGANSKLPLFLALGVVFYQRMNGKQYLISNKMFNVLNLVKVSGFV